ncbi:uncharacterized protein A4U43_C08F21860 [Asparagus officinalis]|nr:uncharacterized protein A4U43_C08F21860 [Asparagus officinalis]
MNYDCSFDALSPSFSISILMLELVSVLIPSGIFVVVNRNHRGFNAETYGDSTTGHGGKPKAAFSVVDAAAVLAVVGLLAVAGLMSSIEISSLLDLLLGPQL